MHGSQGLWKIKFENSKKCFTNLWNAWFLTHKNLTKINVAQLKLNQCFNMILQMKGMEICERIRYNMTWSEHLDRSYKYECIVWLIYGIAVF